MVEGNKIEGNLYGVYIHGAPEAVVRGNEITGLRDGRVNEAGNGVSVWDAPGAKVLDNDIRFGRDGIFSIASRRTCSAATASATCALPSTTCTPTTARSPTTSRSATPSGTR